MVIWRVRQSEIDDLITYMFRDYWNMINFEDGVAPFFLRYASYSKRFTKCYLFLVANALVLFCGLPLVQTAISKMKGSPTETRTFLFPGWYPEGWEESPFYEMALLSQILATGSCAAVILAMDTLVATALFHTCGHFKIIQKNLRNIGEVAKHVKIKDRRSKELSKILVRQKLGAYIEHHQVVLRFSDTMERLFSPIMLCQVLASVMIICLVGLQVSSTLTDRDEVLKYMSYLIMALFQLILFCLPGNDLITQSLAVSDAAYATNWYEDSELLKTDVRFIITRGQRPAKITAGKFTVMSLEHFGTVLSTSISYFTVLRSLS